jgi:hypothetical protein
MGRDTVADAAAALRLLNSEDLRHHPAHGPTERRTPSTTPAAPLNLGMVDYIAQARDEVVAHARAVAPDPQPLPRRVEDLYDWYVDQTGNADEAQRRHRDTLIEAHRLKHAVRLGEYDEISKNPCPRCGCWGLMWEPGGQRALCSNRRCRTPDGLSSRWTLDRLAAQTVQRTEIWRRNAT